MRRTPKSFSDVIRRVGRRPALGAAQGETRIYSEKFSREIALWLREFFQNDPRGYVALKPEGKVKTIYGTKSLDVGLVDSRGYLRLDISIKTFNFKDSKTSNYRHNFTGRFYELLGEELDLRRSYRWSTLAAFIFLPHDGAFDSEPSSFAHAVRQFSKICDKSGSWSSPEHFDHVFVVLYNTDGRLVFFDALNSPPRKGVPAASQSLSVEQVLETLNRTVDLRASEVGRDALPVAIPFKYS